MYSLSQRSEKLVKLGLLNLRVVLVEGEKSKLELLNKTGIGVKNDTGFLLACDPSEHMTFAMIAEVGIYARHTHVFEVTGPARNIQRLADQTPSETYAHHIKLVPTHPDKNGAYVTKDNDFQNNNFWLMNTEGGKLQMWQIGIVTNIAEGYSKYYLSIQLVYSADMYKDGNKIIIPEDQFSNYKEWLSLQKFLEGHVDFESLRHVSELRNEITKTMTVPHALGPYQCKVLWFNQCRRYGLGQITRNGTGGKKGTTATVRIHATEIEGSEFPALDPGQIVNFKNLRPNPKGFDLLGVTE